MFKKLKKVLLNNFKSFSNKITKTMQFFKPLIIELLNFTNSFYSSISITTRAIALFLALLVLICYNKMFGFSMLNVGAIIFIILLFYHLLNFFSLISNVLYLCLSLLIIIFVSKSLLVSFGFYILIKFLIIRKLILLVALK